MQRVCHSQSPTQTFRSSSTRDPIARNRREIGGATVRITRAQKQAVKVLAESLLAEHGLHDWRIADYTRHRLQESYDASDAGWCYPESKTIFLRLSLLARYIPEQCREVILHEIAHALAPSLGHHAEWAETARRIGIHPFGVLFDLASVMHSKSPYRVEDARAARIAFDQQSTALLPCLTVREHYFVHALHTGTPINGWWSPRGAAQ
jgi:hypothetical protein